MVNIFDVRRGAGKFPAPMVGLVVASGLIRLLGTILGSLARSAIALAGAAGRSALRGASLHPLVRSTHVLGSTSRHPLIGPTGLYAEVVVYTLRVSTIDDGFFVEFRRIGQLILGCIKGKILPVRAGRKRLKRNGNILPSESACGKDDKLNPALIVDDEIFDAAQLVTVHSLYVFALQIAQLM